MADNVILLFNKTPNEWRDIVLKTLRSGGGPVLLFFLLVAVFIGNPFYTVGPTENVIVQRFGRHVRTTTSGLHFKLPWPIETITTVDMQIRELALGFGSSGGASRPWEAPRQSGENRRADGPGVLMLTGDENIVRVWLSAQYRVIEPADYLFNMKDPGETVIAICEASLRRVVGDWGVDSALTEGKAIIQSEIQELSQELVDRYGLGLEIVKINLNDVQPPTPVAPSYTEVISAKEDKDKAINVAEGYRNGEIPRAEGEAAAVVNEASAYAQERILRAEGEVRRFSDLLTEYRSAPEVTKNRLYLETMEVALENAEVTLIDKNLGKMLPLYDLSGSAPKLPAVRPTPRPAPSAPGTPRAPGGSR